MQLSIIIMADQNAGVFHRSVHGAKWLIIGNIVQKLLSLVTFFVLARLLTPYDYGVIAAVFALFSFLETATNFSFGRALVQSGEDVEPYLDTLWTFDLLKSLIISALIFISAPLVAGFFHIGDFTNLIRLSGMFVVFSGLSNSRQIYFFKDLALYKVFWRDFVSQVFYTVIAIVWAIYVQRSAWALLAGHLARYFVSCFMSYALLPVMPALSFNFGRLKKFIGYSRWVMGQNILNYFLNLTDNIYVGRLLGASTLGFYSKSKDLALTPIAPFFNILNKVGFYAYSKLQDKIIKVEDGFLKTFDIMLGISLPIFFILYIEGGCLVQLVLGQQWLTLVVPLKILAASAVFMSLNYITNPVFDALGRPDFNFKSNIIQIASIVVFMYLGIHFWGLIGAALAMLASNILVFAFDLKWALALLKMRWRVFLPGLVSVSFAIVAVLILAVPFRMLNVLPESNRILIFAWLLVLGAVYVASLRFMGRFFKRGPWQTFLSILQEMGVKLGKKQDLPKADIV